MVVKPIVFGNKSQYFGKKRESDGHTHWWQIYVKPFNEHEVGSLFALFLLAIKVLLLEIKNVFSKAHPPICSSDDDLF